jgi:hypothetical protein
MGRCWRMLSFHEPALSEKVELCMPSTFSLLKLKGFGAWTSATKSWYKFHVTLRVTARDLRVTSSF